MAKVKNVEWMFGDACSGILGFHALADLNPLRWSGPISFDECIKQLEKVRSVGNNRPIIVKVPAGISSREQQCASVTDAIEYIKSKDPQRQTLRGQFEMACEEVKELEIILKESIEKKETTEKNLNAKIAAAGSKPSAKTQWMYSDPETPLGGLGRFFAQYNPARWSKLQTPATTIKDLEGLQKHHEEHNEKPRGIRLLIQKPGEEKVQHAKDHAQDFSDETAAIQVLMALIEVDDPELHALEDQYEEANAHVQDAEKNLREAQAEKAVKEAACKEAGV